jgi:hypothetical protein
MKGGLPVKPMVKAEEGGYVTISRSFLSMASKRAGW